MSVFFFFCRSTGNYHPIVYVNEFWLQKKHLVALNATVETVTLDLSFDPISIWKFQVSIAYLLIVCKYDIYKPW